MKSVNTHEAKTRLSEILREISKGETYLICKNGEPIARISPYIPEKRTVTDPVLSQISINYDPVEVLQEDEWGEID